MAVFRGNDRMLGDQVVDGGGVAYIQSVKMVDGEGAASGFSDAIGSPADAAWDGVAANATVISLLKAIALNTTPAP